VLPGIAFRSGLFDLPDQMTERAFQYDLVVFRAAAKLRWLDGVEIAPPGVTVAAPLRMQRRHADEGAPQRHAGAYEALTKTVEDSGGVGAAQALAHHPGM